MTSPDLAGKVAIVTGAGSRASGIGIGRAAAVLLAKAGARVVAVDLTLDHLTETRALIESAGGTCITISGDVTSEEDCQAIVAEALETWGRIDILVNNVGIAGSAASVVDLEMSDWEHCVATNLTSMVRMSRLTIPQMRSTGGGSIINISSAAGLRALYPGIAYSTTKGAISNMTRSMAATHGPEGVRVNAVAPGMVYTPMVTAQDLSQESRDRRRLMAPLQTEGTGWDIGHAVVFLASDQARWITGVVLPVDAGLTCAVPVGGTLEQSYSDIAQYESANEEDEKENS